MLPALPTSAHTFSFMHMNIPTKCNRITGPYSTALCLQHWGCLALISLKIDVYLAWICAALAQALYIFLVLLGKARQTKRPLNCTALSQLISQRALVAACIRYSSHTASKSLLHWLPNAVLKAGKYFSPEIYHFFSNLQTFSVSSSALSSWIPTDGQEMLPSTGAESGLGHREMSQQSENSLVRLRCHFYCSVLWVIPAFLTH